MFTFLSFNLINMPKIRQYGNMPRHSALRPLQAPALCSCLKCSGVIATPPSGGCTVIKLGSAGVSYHRNERPTLLPRWVSFVFASTWSQQGFFFLFCLFIYFGFCFACFSWKKIIFRVQNIKDYFIMYIPIGANFISHLFSDAKTRPIYAPICYFLLNENL